MKAMYERSKISGEDLSLFPTQFKAVIKEVEAYLLNIHCILLKPEYIFYEESRFFFLLLSSGRSGPVGRVSYIDRVFCQAGIYEDQECVRLVFLLHKATMEENYSLKRLWQRMLNILKRTKRKKQ